MMRRNVCKCMIVASVFMAVAVQGAIITDVSIRAVSSEQPEWSLAASNLVSGVGIGADPNSDPNIGGINDGNTFTTDYTKMWCNSSWVWTDPSDEWIEFDLGRLVSLSRVKIWNYNQPGFTGRGVYQFRMGLSVDGANWDYSEGYFQLTEGPGDDTTPYANIFDIYNNSYFRYVRFDNMYITRGPEYIGLSQVRFYGTPSPNGAPTVDAGISQTIKAPNTAMMAATATDDGLVSPLAYAWIQESGPGTATFSPNANVLNPVITFPAVGVYGFRLTVDDGEWDASDTVYVNVLPANWNAISGVSVAGYSSLYNWYRHPLFAVNGWGLIELGGDGFAHLSTTGDVSMWSSEYATDVNGQYLVFDLGAPYVLNNLRLWNYNESWSNNKAMGVGEFEVLASAADPTVSAGTSLGVFTAGIAPGTQDYDYSQVFTISNSNLFRYVKLNVHTNLGFQDQWGRTVGIAEIMFSGYQNGCLSQLSGDLDGNCVVNVTDLSLLAQNWLEDTSL